MSERTKEVRVYKYSDELIERLQKLYKEKWNVNVSKEEFDLYLDDMADLYGVFVKIK